VLTKPFALHCIVGASNTTFDVLLKTGLIVFAAFRLEMNGPELSLVTALAWSLFMAPFFLFSAHGGHLGDHFNKRRISIALRSADIAIAGGITYGFYAGNIVLLLALIFAKGTTATLYSPIKYSLISDLLSPPMQSTGSALLEAVTMTAILSGTYLGSALGADPDPRKIGMLALAIVGVSFAATLFCPNIPQPQKPRPMIGFDPIKPSVRILHRAIQNRGTLAAIISLSWFWALGAVYLSNIASLVRDIVHGDGSLTSMILVIFTLGLSAGLGSGAWLTRSPFARYVSYAMAISIAALGINLLFVIPTNINRMLFEFFAIAFSAGVYAAYYTSLLYESAHDTEKSSVFAANNIASSVFIVTALAGSTLLIHLGISLPMCLALFSGATIPVTIFAHCLLSRYFPREPTP